MGATRAWKFCLSAPLLGVLIGGAAWAANAVDSALQPIPQSGAAAAPNEPAPNSLGLYAAPQKPCAGDCETPCGKNYCADGSCPTGGACNLGGDGCNFCGDCFCGPPGRVWFRGEYLYWWTSGERLPPLVTTGIPATGGSADTDPVGSLGRTSTDVLFGDENVNTYGRSGYRIAMGAWIDACHRWGIEGDFYDIGPGTTSYFVESDDAGSPALARPLYDVENGTEWRELVSYPGALAGSVSVGVDDYFQSAGIGARYNLCCVPACGCSDPCDPCASGCGDGSRLDFLAGYRYYRLEDTVTINENLTLLQAPLANYGIKVTDSFRARNDFNGAEIGLALNHYRGPWSLGMTMRMALGNTRSRVTINGSTTVSDPSGNNVTYDAGVYAVDTNIGSYSRNAFTIIPQLGLEGGYQVTCNLRAYLGYNLLYWACVQRAGSAIDLNIDPRNVPGPNGSTDSGATHFPQFEFCGSSFWAQGINGGLELSF